MRTPEKLNIVGMDDEEEARAFADSRLNMSQMFGSVYQAQPMIGSMISNNNSLANSMASVNSRSYSSIDLMNITLNKVRNMMVRPKGAGADGDKSAVHDQAAAFNFISKCLPDFTPINKSESKILDAAAIKLLSVYLPPLIRMREWVLLFTLTKHGRSMDTFYQCVKDRDNVLLVI